MQNGNCFFRLLSSLGLALTLSGGLSGVGSGLLADEAAKSDDAKPAAEVSAGVEVPLGEFIDQQIRQGWQDNEIEQSAAATDDEWVRRIYLDLLGRIPTMEEARKFLADESPRKRSVLIEELLEHEDYVRNFTTIWSNNCISRKRRRPNQDPPVSRTGMEKFFREAFAKNRPWNEVVVDIVTASGHYEENGAVNYTLAQMEMEDDAVQLTAMTARLFLGVQVQCTQCHNHPFNKWQQDQFWQYNSFFRQVDKIDHQKLDPNTGRMVDDYSEVVWQEFSGPVYYEKRSGVMQVAFPRFLGHEVDPGIGVDRRAEFAKLLSKSDDGTAPLIAQSMVNRTWSHFFGHGFTRPVDDMGPHNPASHPELLERLSQEFVRANYDVKELIRWIVSTESYSLTSRFGEKNKIDDPSAGEMPLFSHMYMKSLQPEQIYSSLLTASNAHAAGKSGWDDQEEQRRAMLRSFLNEFPDIDDEEATTFSNTIPQALMMMNGVLMEKACSVDRGSFLYETINSPSNEVEKIHDLYLAALCRKPSKGEQLKVQKMLAAYKNQKLLGYQDLFWALLNSNEFVFIH